MVFCWEHFPLSKGPYRERHVEETSGVCIAADTKDGVNMSRQPDASRALPRNIGSRVAVWAAIAAIFTLIILQYSLRHNRLVGPPVQEDITYISDGLSRLQIFYGKGLAYAVRDYIGNPPRSPVSTYVAALGYALFGFHDWAPYACNFIIIFVLLWYVDRLLRGRPLWITAAGFVFVLTAPVASLAIQEYRPDIFCGLLTAIGLIELSRAPFLKASRSHQAFIGAVFGLALLVKATIFIATIGFFSLALGIVVIRDCVLDRRERPWSRDSLMSIGYAVLPALALAAPYYAFNIRWLTTYIVGNTFTSRSSIWAYGGTTADHVRYYLDGPGGRFMLGEHLVLCLGLLGLAGILAVTQANRKGLLFPVSGAAMILMVYAVPTAVRTKDPQGASAFVWALILATVVVMGTSCNHRVGWTPRMIWGRLLVAGCAFVALCSFHMPAKIGSPGDPVTRAVNHFVMDIFDTVMNKVDEAPFRQKYIFVTTYGVINYQLLKYLAVREDRSPHEMPMLVPPDTRELQAFADKVRAANLVLASEPGTFAIAQMMPSAAVQGETLKMVQDSPEFQEIARFPTPSGKYYFLFERKGAFFGWRKSSGLLQETGPRPEENLPLFRWGTLPRTVLTFAQPKDGLVKLTVSCQSRVPNQIVSVTLDGRRVGQFPVAQGNTFQDWTSAVPVIQGEHRVEIDYTASEQTGIGTVIFRRLQIEFQKPERSLSGGIPTRAAEKSRK